MTEIAVIIPALNEDQAIGKVLADIPTDLISEVVVADNDSTDSTAEIAQSAGATVVHEPERGYGAACLRGITYLKSRHPRVDIVVFLDADYSDHPEEMVNLVRPIIEHDFDLVIGSRISGKREKSAMPLYQVFGNRIATGLIRLLYGAKFTDLGPFRAIKFDKLLKLSMKDKAFGWTIEMQVKAAKQKLRYSEVPVNYRTRIGTSKISGTVTGALQAASNIIVTLLRYAVSS